MREEDSNWFSKWEEELPSPEELMPLSQSLITPDLALAFNISASNPSLISHHAPPQPPPVPPIAPQSSSQPNSSAEFDSPELTGGSGDEPARTLKRPRLVWTPQLHKRFVDAVAHLGIKNAVPKTIMQLMSVDGLTRENVASHLQKYRLYLKRMQGISNGGGNNSAAVSGMDAATDHLFASSPVPAHFLHPGRGNSEHYLPYVPVAAAAATAMQHHQVHHQMAVVPPHQMQQQFRHFGNSPPNNVGQFDHHPHHHHPFIRQAQQQQQRMGSGVAAATPVYVEDLESPASNGRKILTLFPTGDD